MTSFPPIEELLRHRPPNLLISEVLSWQKNSIVARADVLPEQWFSNQDGSMPAWVGIELMAQAIAAFVGLEGRNQGRSPKIGYLLGTRKYASAIPSFPANAEVKIRADLVFRDESGLGAFDCALECEGRTVAEATLKVFEEPNSE